MTAADADHATQLRKAVIAGTIGTTIEWYDFFLYSTVTGLVFGKLFFPNSDPADRHAAGLRHLFRRVCRAGPSAAPSSAISATASAANRP